MILLALKQRLFCQVGNLRQKMQTIREHVIEYFYSMKEQLNPGQKPQHHRETTRSPVASQLAGMFLEEQVRKGRTIEIPSLGIVLTKDKLRSSTKTD